MAPTYGNVHAHRKSLIDSSVHTGLQPLPGARQRGSCALLMSSPAAAAATTRPREVGHYIRSRWSFPELWLEPQAT